MNDEDREDDEADDLDEESSEEDIEPSEEEELTAEEEAQLEEERLRKERAYFRVTRGFWAGLLFALPLLAVYEAGALVFGADVNAVAAKVKMPISWLQRHPTEIFGVDLMLIVNSVMIAVVLVAIWRVGRLGALREGAFLGMFAESCVYALLLGPLALAPLTGEFQFAGFSPHLKDFGEKLVISAGAGFYEEGFFRLVLLGAIFYFAKEWGELHSFTAGALALAISGALFSAAHFFLPGAMPDLGAFIYRLAAGMILGLIFLTRGIGIAAWTHAMYDVYVLCFTAQ